jgi:uncharacterized surface protein with fasciclin (FAS1) repeats
MKMNLCFIKKSTKFFSAVLGLLVMNVSIAQTNVFDNIISTSPNHTYLTAAITQQNLQGALQDPTATLTVFAPTDAAFDALATELNTDIAGLLALPNLTDILLYHVLGVTVASGDLSNGITPQPLNASNTIKMTVTSGGDVYANQAQVTTADLTASNGIVHVTNGVLLPNITVVDLAINNNFTILTTAVIQQELVPALSNPFGTFTVFAPTDAAFTDLLDALDITAAELLESEDLTSILLYHVLGIEVPSSAVTNGLLATPLNDENTIKMTVTSGGDVFANHAQVVLADVNADNGVVHAIDAVLLPSFTVVDVALANIDDFSILVTAVIQQGLIPVLSNPLASFTVLAPNNAAFEDLLDGLGITAAQLLADEDLTDILLYHVLGAEVFAADLSNGLLASPVNDENTIKVTLTGSGNVFFNQAQVLLADIEADNGVIHVLDAVILPVTTVVDIAINNDFDYLVAALVQEELIPTLSNPLAAFTVFAPTDQAFEELAAALETDIAGLLGLETLSTVLLYHVVAGEVASTDLENGTVNTLADITIDVNVDEGVMINTSTVIIADVLAFNGIVHVIDRVLVPGGSPVSVPNFDNVTITAYPNPAATSVSFSGLNEASLRIVDLNGSVVFTGSYNGSPLDISDFEQQECILFTFLMNKITSVVRLSIK